MGICILSFFQIDRTEEMLRYGPEDALIGLLPFFHIYGQVVVLLTGLIEGVKTVTVPKFDAQHYLECIQNHRVRCSAY